MGQYVQAVLALGFVLGLIGLLSYILRKFSAESFLVKKGTDTKKSLNIVEILPLDSKRRMVIIQRDNKKHLLLLGMGNDVVVESFDD